jgi:hypothetical protein
MRRSAPLALLATVLVAAVVWRVYNAHTMTAPNLELLTVSGLAAAVLLRSRWAMLVPLGLVVLTDAIIGNTDIFWFTWTAWALIGGAALLLRRLGGWKMVAAGTGLGLGASVGFFLWTNLGVWLMGDGVMYPRSWAGLVTCYEAAIPFYRTMLEGNLVLVPVVLTAAALVQARVRVQAPALRTPELQAA